MPRSAATTGLPSQNTWVVIAVSSPRIHSSEYLRPLVICPVLMLVQKKRQCSMPHDIGKVLNIYILFITCSLTSTQEFQFFNTIMHHDGEFSQGDCLNYGHGKVGQDGQCHVYAECVGCSESLFNCDMEDTGFQRTETYSQLTNPASSSTSTPEAVPLSLLLLREQFRRTTEEFNASQRKLNCLLRGLTKTVTGSLPGISHSPQSSTSTASTPS